MIGETVVIHRRQQTGTNAHNQPVYEWTETPVDDVLVAPGARTDIPENARPDGTTVAWTLHFPKTYTGGPLRGTRISVRGEEAAPVIGDPQPYTTANTPTRWNMPVELQRTDG